MDTSSRLTPGQSDLLAAAKLWLTAAPAAGIPRAGDMPYLSTALYALVPVPTGRVATMATDPAWHLYVNPAWLDEPSCTVPRLAAWLAHHVWHLLADHAGRAGDVRVCPATSRAWRAAADLTIHPLLAGIAPTPSGVGPGIGSCRPGARVPRWAREARDRAMADEHVMLPPAALGLPANRAAEEYYAALSGLPVTAPDESPDPAWRPRASGASRGTGPTGGDAARPRGTGTSSPDPCATPSPDPCDIPSPDPCATPPPATGAGPVGAGSDPSCGSGCDGLRRDYEVADPEGGGLSAGAAEGIRRSVAVAFRQARPPGTVPGEWDRWVEQVLDPVVDWRNVLHAAVRRGIGWAQGHSDYTYTRVSRRQAAAGPVILPALRRPVPRVGVVLDTSGSVDDGLLAQALGEVDGVLATLGVADPQVSVLAVDSAVQAVTTARRADAVRLSGGGGTDMSLGISAALQLRPAVDVVIVLTDGHTGWPDRPAPVPVIAVLLGHSRADLPRTPPWVQRVECVP